MSGYESPYPQAYGILSRAVELYRAGLVDGAFLGRQFDKAEAEVAAAQLKADLPVADPLLDLLNTTSVEDSAGLKPWR